MAKCGSIIPAVNTVNTMVILMAVIQIWHPNYIGGILGWEEGQVKTAIG